ncbi:hypothetical protein LOD59_05880 [Xylella fastidiosa subsp. multiplex]|uniref:hypothetical protein n=1 Tax=Xylella fastidiosa TaxID=2371 RepID=UPI00235E8FE7|nr:hypothetical protein [Xylella fastidiosa]MDD0927183.1 hypothetical protein [Xylella fastidiosa subsp. multiplex]
MAKKAKPVFGTPTNSCKWLGYESWQAFQNVITKAMGTCSRLGLDPTEAFVREEIVQDGKAIKTYQLSRGEDNSCCHR